VEEDSPFREKFLEWAGTKDGTKIDLDQRHGASNDFGAI